MEIGWDDILLLSLKVYEELLITLFIVSWISDEEANLRSTTSKPNLFDKTLSSLSSFFLALIIMLSSFLTVSCFTTTLSKSDINFWICSSAFWGALT